MSTDPVVALLAKQSKSRLRQMQREIEDQLDGLKIQGELVARALAEKGEPARNGSGSKPGTGGSGNNKREMFLDIIGSRPDHLWRPADMRAALKERGVESESAAIRVMLRRMGEAGLIERGPGNEGWRLASKNGSVQEPLQEVDT